MINLVVFVQVSYKQLQAFNTIIITTLFVFVQGDSGGPLFRADTGALVGVTSFINTDGCQNGLPQGFTRVSSHLEWIEQVSGVSCKK